MAVCTISWGCLFLSLSLVFSLMITNSIVAQTSPPGYIYALCSDMTSVSPNSIYQTNLNTLLSFLNSNSTNKNRFYNTTVGNGTNKIYGLLFCRIDDTTAGCQECVSLATEALTTRCPGKKVSIIWYYDQCLVRYSNESFFGRMNASPMIPMWSRQNVLDISNITSNLTSFMEVLVNTLEAVTVQAANAGVDRKYATKEDSFATNLTNLNKIYTLAECTSDMSVGDCKSCLQMSIGNMSELCNLKSGCTLMCPNCFMRYDINPFYGDDTTSSGPSSLALFGGTHRKISRGKRAILLGAVISSALAIALLFGIWIFVWKRKSNKAFNDLNDIESEESLKFDCNTIRCATHNFSEDKKLGEGGFGEVFKGKLESGEEVAVKRLSRKSSQGISEFKTEILLVAKLQHRNLVKLLGFCLTRTEKLLVYEFLPNSSLDKFLFDPTKSASLDWETRYKIISGIARGLLYLHEDSRLKIIHRDLKSSNVLLDKDMNPKISDFGMARLFRADETQGNTSRIAGTLSMPMWHSWEYRRQFSSEHNHAIKTQNTPYHWLSLPQAKYFQDGYMAPEYVITGQYSVKSDVYSFGILVLEIVSGQRNKFFTPQQDDESLLRRAWRLWNEELVMELVDPTIGNEFSREEVAKCIHIGLLCIQEDAGKRPRMASVVAALNGDAIVLPSPTPPHFFMAGAFAGFQECEADQCVTAFSGTKSITVLDPR